MYVHEVLGCLCLDHIFACVVVLIDQYSNLGISTCPVRATRRRAGQSTPRPIMGEKRRRNKLQDQIPIPPNRLTNYPFLKNAMS